MIRVALGQIDTTVGDLDGNVAKMAEWAERATEAGADLICFPELAVPGYPPEDLVLRPAFVRDNLEALEDLARVRRRTVDLLHGWGKAEWDRTIADPRGGGTTLLEVCQLVARHEMGHIAQIRNLSALLPEPQDLGPVRQPGVNGS